MMKTFNVLFNPLNTLWLKLSRKKEKCIHYTPHKRYLMKVGQ